MGFSLSALAYRGILHDPKMYPNPSAFEPERYLKGGKLNTEDVLDPEDIAFGFGRRYVKIRPCTLSECSIWVRGHRICPGRYFSNAAMFAIVASVLAVFNISSDGPAIPPQQTSSIIS